ncbi:NAD(P)-binding domain [Penicillium camemberti]|uniref:NAD(P)-binding domain n=1 Tax=Penicillium camemberti (strain FM 013) TaxID=1429867 RepID=A0A0G4PPU1_PENC3|nr:NAD(P)-binding domain [Penicillium camemberti]
MSKVITVFGATGNQGGSVIDAIIADPKLSKEFKIRGITRDTTKKTAQDLVKRGVDVVSADLDAIDSLTAALKGSHTVFLVTNYWETMNADVEYSQGKNVTDVVKAVGVSHLIFSSLHHVTEETKGRLTNVPHFDSKANIEKYIRASGSDMLVRAEDGSYHLFYPVGKQAKFPLFDAAQDTGLFVRAALKHGDQLKNKQILAAAKYYTPDEIVDTFSKVTGKKAVFIQVSPEQYKASLPAAMADEYLDNQLFVEEPGYYLGEPLEPSLSLVDGKPTTWEEFVKKNISTWK